MSSHRISARVLRDLFLILACLAVALPSQAQIPIFSGAEGYGGTWSGTAPSGGWLSNATVYHVTNLNDDGPGSFRDAFQENSANKIIVFDVAGTIELTSGKLDIKNLANYYIAGQTAPGPVTIYGDMAQLTHSSGKENRNVALRYLSFRKGTGNNSDSITFAGSGLGTNLILDHVSASWSEDEILSVANNNTNVTVQYSMIHDALVNNHAYGSLIRPRISSEVTFHHNLYANNASRQARFGTYNGETLTADFRNNVVYNWRDRASYTGGSSSSDQEYTDVNYVGNYLVAGPGTTSNSTFAYHVDKNVDTRVYQSGNFIDPDDAPGGAPADGVLDGSDTGTSMFVVSTPVTDQSLTFMASPFSTPAVTTQTAPEAYDQVVNYVGNWWWNRDAIDSRVIGNVTNFTGVPIGANAPIASELNGLLTAPQVNHAAGYDADNDGMEDSWEAMHGGDLVWNQDFDNDGYINLLDFINEKGEFPAPAPIVFNGSTNSRYALITNWNTDDGGVTTGSNWQPSKFDLAVIENGTVEVDAVGQHAGTLLVAPDPGNNASLNLTSGWLAVNDLIEIGSASGTGTLSLSSPATLVSPMVTVGELGTINGEGLIDGNVLNNGLVSPGNSPGVLEISGDFAQNAAGTLLMEIASASSYDELHIDGSLFAGGTLDIDLLGYSPQDGDSFDLFDFTSATGSFTIDLPALDPGLSWDASNLFTTGELAVTGGVTIPEDLNGDGFVDSLDLGILLGNWGTNTTPDMGELDGTPPVDGLDLGILLSAWNPPPAAATVPEPSGLALLFASINFFFFSRSAILR